MPNGDDLDRDADQTLKFCGGEARCRQAPIMGFLWLATIRPRREAGSGLALWA